MINTNTGLKTFILGNSNPDRYLPGCSNYDRHYEVCMDGNPCRVMEGKRCRYFEKAVLPIAQESGRDKVLDEYNSLADTLFLSSSKICEMCSAPVQGRNRFCDKCKKKRTREYQRQWRNSLSQM